MSKLYQINITKQTIYFFGRTRELTFFSHRAELNGTCDDEKWYELINKFLDAIDNLDWDCVEDLIEEEEQE